MKKNIRIRVSSLILILILVVFQYNPAEAADRGLAVHFIDVGQADAAVIVCDGKTLMIDGGNAADSQLIYSYLTETLHVARIDYMIATHPHEDHLGGLVAAFRACQVGVVFSPVTEWNTKVFQNLVKYAMGQGTPITTPKNGQKFKLGRAKVTLWNPVKEASDVNDLSIVTRLVFKRTAFLFMADAGYEVENALLRSGVKLEAQVLKVAHHGSASATSEEFLQAVAPLYAILDVEEGNDYGHPSEKTLERLEKINAQIYRTDYNGHIVCTTTNGRKLTITAQYEGPKSRKPTVTTTTEGTTTGYVANISSKKFHSALCGRVAGIKEKNRVVFATRKEALEAGCVPGTCCNP